MDKPPLSDVQRDALIRTMTRQLRDAESQLQDAWRQIDEADKLTHELRTELLAAHEEIAALKRGLVPEQPF